VPERKRYKGARAGALAVALSAALLALPSAASANVTASINAAGALSVSSNAGDQIDITCDGMPGNVKVNGNDPAGGPAACSAVTSITVEGGPDGNAINLNGVTDELFTGLTSVTVNGNGGNDTILGSEINDVLNGGDGNDRVVGFRNVAPTRDVMTGGEGDDTLVWNNGDGSDTMDGQNGNDTIEVNGGAAAEQFTVQRSATDPTRVVFDRVDPAPFNLDIGTAEKLDLNANAGDDSLNAAGGAAGLAPFVVDADGGDGNDLLNGGDAADVLTGGIGNDRLVAFRNPAGSRDVMAGGEGDDTLVWNNGDGSDTMDGENGNDTVEVNGGTADEQFTIAPSPTTPGRVSFDRVNPGPFNLDIGSSENLQLNANAGNDEITGAEGLAGLIVSTLNGDDNRDEIKGTDGEDRLNGGRGFDLIRSRDKAEDLVDCGGGFDVAFVDKRDFVRGCEVVLGGRQRVRLARTTMNVAGGAIALPLRCVVAERCKGTALLRHKGKSLGSARFNISRKKAKTVRLKLNRRALRLLSDAPAKGLRAQLRIKARDNRGNGWETRPSIRVKD
jgi:Ca2+-binding RTX toxin-like protein